MQEAYSLYKSIPGDVLILMCLFIGATARLARDESISAWAALKEFYYSLVAGAVFTGFFIWLTDLDLKGAWWIAVGAPLSISVIVEIALKKAHDIRDMDFKETIVFIFDEVKKRFSKSSPTS